MIVSFEIFKDIQEFCIDIFVIYTQFGNNSNIRTYKIRLLDFQYHWFDCRVKKIRFAYLKKSKIWVRCVPFMIFMLFDDGKYENTKFWKMKYLFVIQPLKP